MRKSKSGAIKILTEEKSGGSATYKKKGSKVSYNELLRSISTALTTARENSLSFINQQLLDCYWEVGKYIVQYEQHGNIRADYGSNVLIQLSADLQRKFGRGFSRQNLQYMRLFYTFYPKFHTGRKSQTSDFFSKKSSGRNVASGKLTWSHYCELLSITDDMARSFYQQQSQRENWSFRELKRNIDSSLFERLALSKDKKGVLALAKKGNRISRPEDAIKDPYVFEFIGVPQSKRVSERGLQKRLVLNLQKFIMELGKGFSLVGHDYKITIDNEHYFIDLVFYHRILKCFVLVDLKTRKVRHQDIGQMNLYLNYFNAEENSAGDGPAVGIIIAADKNELLVKYATGGLSNKIFVSKYQLYLPSQKILENKLKELILSNPK